MRPRVVIRTAERYDSRNGILHALWLDHGVPLLLGLPLLALLAALLRNLVENALRHVPQGGEVQFVIARIAHEATIDVIDDGLGIPVEQRAAVFARFHREKSSRGEGYGLDLSIVQRAAELHNASIELLGSPFGSGLRVTIPVIE